MSQEPRSGSDLEARDRLSDLQPTASTPTSTQRGKWINFRRASLEEAALLTHLSLALHDDPVASIGHGSPSAGDTAAAAHTLPAKQTAVAAAMIRHGPVPPLAAAGGATATATAMEAPSGRAAAARLPGRGGGLSADLSGMATTDSDTSTRSEQFSTQNRQRRKRASS